MLRWARGAGGVEGGGNRSGCNVRDNKSLKHEQK